MVQIYKPNIETIRQQAQAAREAEERRKQSYGDSKYNWGTLKDGENYLRILPPTNSRGILGRTIGKHYFTGTPLSKLDTQTCSLVSFPEMNGAVCPICDTGDRLIAQFPQLDIKRWYRPGTYVYIQALDREEPEKLAKIYRLTPSIYNWLLMEIESVLEREKVDITDPDNGLDVKITKGQEKMRNGKMRTKYSSTIYSPRGVTPIAESQAAIQAVFESMIQLDDVWSYPSDEKFVEIQATASKVYSYYMSNQVSANGARLEPTPMRPQVVTPTSPIPRADPLPRAQPQQRVVTQEPEFVEPQQNLAEQAAAEAQQVVQAAVQSSAAQASLPLQSSPTPQAPSSPSEDRPSCFGGAAPREDGGTGFSEESEQCLMCVYEMKCMDACQG